MSLTHVRGGRFTSPKHLRRLQLDMLLRDGRWPESLSHGACDSSKRSVEPKSEPIANDSRVDHVRSVSFSLTYDRGGPYGILTPKLVATLTRDGVAIER